MMPNGTWFDPVFLREVVTVYPCESQLTVKEIKRVIETTEEAYFKAKVNERSIKFNQVHRHTITGIM